MAYIDALEVTLKNMLPSTSCFNMNINTNMGFLLGIWKHCNIFSLKSNILYLNNIIDAEIRMDNKYNFINVDSENSDNKNEDFIK